VAASVNCKHCVRILSWNKYRTGAVFRSVKAMAAHFRAIRRLHE
jgi:hypothetical protein